MHGGTSKSVVCGQHLRIPTFENTTEQYSATTLKIQYNDLDRNMQRVLYNLFLE